MGSRNLELSIYVDGQSSLPRSEIVSGGDAKQNQGRGRRGSLQTGTNVFKDKYLPSLSLLPFAAATTVGILAPRQKSYGTGSSPSIFHACLPLSLSPPLWRRRCQRSLALKLSLSHGRNTRGENGRQDLLAKSGYTCILHRGGRLSPGTATNYTYNRTCTTCTVCVSPATKLTVTRAPRRSVAVAVTRRLCDFHGS